MYIYASTYMTEPPLTPPPPFTFFFAKNLNNNFFPFFVIFIIHNKILSPLRYLTYLTSLLGVGEGDSGEVLY